MKIFVRLMMLVLVLGLAGPFFLKGPNGQPWMKPADVMPDTRPVEGYIHKLRAMVSGWFSEEPLEPIGQTKVYRWKSPEGNWQLSDTPPDGVTAEVIFVDPDTNLIQGLRAQKESVSANKTEAENTAPAIPLPMTISPNQVKKLVGDAKAVQETLNQRTQDMDAILSGRAPEKEK